MLDYQNIYQSIYHTVVDTDSELALKNMNLPDYNPSDSQNQWKRFDELLWHDENLGLWLDISRMKINKDDFAQLTPHFENALSAMSNLENGFIANQDEKRMVGHYWLRDPELSPDNKISQSIKQELCEIETFAHSILASEQTNDAGLPFTDVLWIGIGGSGLGPLLIVKSLQKLNSGLNFHFIDNTDPIGISNTINKLSSRLATTLFVIVSKSGGTPEPQMGMDQARFALEKTGCNWASRAIAITMKNSKLDNLAVSENWLKTFDLPDWVGGRTSITGAVGLLPLALINSNINSFLSGAAQMDKLTRNTNLLANPAVLLAAAWYASGQGKGLKDMVVLPYRDSLEVFSRYLQQLVMESLGKKNDRKGRVVNQGLAVYGNKGSTDQHAYVQQLRDGIDNFFVSFIEVLQNNQLPIINGRSTGDHLSGFFQGTRLALSQNNRQSLTITLKTFNESTLGALIALFERTVGIYAELIDINAYDQPGVEAGKKAASEILLLKSEIENYLLDGKTHSIAEISNNINGSSKESIFLIARSMASNNSNIIVEGSWSSPSDIKLKYKVN